TAPRMPERPACSAAVTVKSGVTTARWRAHLINPLRITRMRFSRVSLGPTSGIHFRNRPTLRHVMCVCYVPCGGGRATSRHPRLARQDVHAVLGAEQWSGVEATCLDGGRRANGFQVDCR